MGVIYFLLVGRWLLPDRTSLMAQVQNPREYTVEMMVEPNSPLVGKSLEQAGLRHLSGMYLMEIHRHDEVLTAVGSEQRLQADDRLMFVGIVESVKELHRVRGLKPATNQVFKLESPRYQRCLVEAVVSDTFPLRGKTIREGRFRSVYNAAVIAVARGGERIRAKNGDIILRPGDTLLMEASPAFVEQQRDSRDFLLVSRMEDSTPRRHE